MISSSTVFLQLDLSLPPGSLAFKASRPRAHWVSPIQRDLEACAICARIEPSDRNRLFTALAADGDGSLVSAGIGQCSGANGIIPSSGLASIHRTFRIRESGARFCGSLIAPLQIARRAPIAPGSW